ncbi:MAG: ankyrin repeat domain-containing protein, partial [Acholeplasmataceae bacterium]
KNGLLPVHYAIMAGNEDVVEYLLRVGEQSWFQKDTSGSTLLHYAARTQSVRMIERSLTQDLDPNDLNDQYETPLFNAVRYGTKETLRCLLDQGAYIDIANRRYETPLEIARIHDRNDLVSSLLDHAAKPEYLRLAEAQALTLAVLNRDHKALRERIEKGIPMRRDARRKTALDYAKAYGLTSCVRLLRDVEINGKTTTGCRENANMI